MPLLATGQNFTGIAPVPSAGIKIATTRVALSGSIGTQDITISGFGTPKAAMFILTGCDGAIRDGLYASMGATDGTNQWFVGMSADDNDAGGSGAKFVRRSGDTDAIGDLFEGAVSIAFDSWITDGVRINATAAISTYLLTVVLFGGSDLSAAVSKADMGTSGTPVTVNTGFEPNALISMTMIGGAGLTPVAPIFWMPGLASWDGSTVRQAAMCFRDDDTSPVQTKGSVRSDAVTSSSSATLKASVDNFTSTGFDITANSDWSAHDFFFLALNLAGGAQAFASLEDSPTSTGDFSITGVGFTPIFGLAFPNMMQAVNTFYEDGSASGLGVGVFTANAEYAQSFSARDAVNPSDTQTTDVAQAIDLYDHTKTHKFVASLSSFDSDGATLNFTTVDGTARKWPMLFIG